jgi:hypothetical protein
VCKGQSPLTCKGEAVSLKVPRNNKRQHWEFHLFEWLGRMHFKFMCFAGVDAIAAREGLRAQFTQGPSMGDAGARPSLASAPVKRSLGRTMF